MKLIIAIVFSITLLAAGCEDPAANKPKAVTSEPSASKSASNSDSLAATPAAAKGEALTISAETSKVSFVGSKVTGSHNGGFKEFSGSIDLVNARPEESSVQVKMDANSVFADDPGLTDHLKSADFFDAAKFPFASFRSTKIEPTGVTGEYTVTGDLELRGTPKSVTFPARIDVSDDAVSVKADFRINRKDFGIVYAGKADNLIRDDVAITLDVKAGRQR